MLSVFRFICTCTVLVVFHVDEYVICIKWEVVYNIMMTDLKNEMLYITKIMYHFYIMIPVKNSRISVLVIFLRKARSALREVVFDLVERLILSMAISESTVVLSM